MTNEETKNELEKQEEARAVPTVVTPLQPIARQVGEHVLHTLNDEKTVAVLTTITGSSAGQQVISIPLTPEHVQQVHRLIEEIHTSDEPQQVPCVGFHCFIDANEQDEKSDD